ncbi:MAG: hypothetical protein ED557_01415 [Balneola sp.]|nr:MAG: hypothetical protein ED557_01415 [Balneola sp.]
MLRFILLGIVACSSFYVWTIFPINHGPGQLVNTPPTIERLSWEKPFSFKYSTVTPLRKISGEVRVLKKRRYYFDSKREYSPVDILVGWKELSDERNLEYLHFSLSDRYYDLNYSSPPLPLNDVYKQIDLWHLVPSSKEIAKQVKSIREGSIVEIEGLIVNMEFEDDFPWESELVNSSRSGQLKTNIIWINKISIH